MLLLSCLCHRSTSRAFHATSTPPLLDVPVFSLATLGDGPPSGEGTMNILTYASPVSIQPQRMWSIALYKGTMSHENFARERRGVLQMLRPEHARCRAGNEAVGGLIRTLGGCSGRDVDKRALCAELGYDWETLPKGEEDGEEAGHWPLVLPSCLYYLKLELVGDLIDCGNHEVALCRVAGMLTPEGKAGNAAEELDSLSTRQLRDMSIISELGRVIPLE